MRYTLQQLIIIYVINCADIQKHFFTAMRCCPLLSKLSCYRPH